MVAVMYNIKKQLGQKIKKLRKSRSLTQEKLAEIINIEVPSLSNIETGKFAPSVDTLQKICEALNVEPWEFYYFNVLSHEEMVDKINQKIKDNFDLAKVLYNFLKAVE